MLDFQIYHKVVLSSTFTQYYM